MGTGATIPNHKTANGPKTTNSHSKRLLIGSKRGRENCNEGTNEKAAHPWDARLNQTNMANRILALACFKATLRLVDYVCTALTTNHTTIAVTRLQGLQAIANFHGPSSYKPVNT